MICTDGTTIGMCLCAIGCYWCGVVLVYCSFFLVCFYVEII